MASIKSPESCRTEALNSCGRASFLHSCGTKNKGLRHYVEVIAGIEQVSAYDYLNERNFILALTVGLIVSPTCLNATRRVKTRRAVRIWLDIMSSNNRCLLSGSHLKLLSLMKVLKGERKA